MPNITVNVTPELLRQAKIYASKNNTTLSNIVRDKLNEVTRSEQSAIEKYAQGLITSSEGQQALNLATREEFFHEVCRAGHQLYHIPREQAERLANEALIATGIR